MDISTWVPIVSILIGLLGLVVGWVGHAIRYGRNQGVASTELLEVKHKVEKLPCVSNGNYLEERGREQATLSAISVQLTTLNLALVSQSQRIDSILLNLKK